VVTQINTNTINLHYREHGSVTYLKNEKCQLGKEDLSSKRGYQAGFSITPSG
jgi:hypothetical protein